MSISKVHELLNNKGCVWTVSILMLLGIVGSSFFQCNRADHFNAMSQRAPGTPVAVVDGQTITDSVLDEEVQKAEQRNPPQANSTPLAQATNSLNNQLSALNNLVGSAAMIELAKKYNVTVSDDDVMKQVQAAFDDSMKQAKEQLTMYQQLKPNATDEDFAQAYKKMTGKDPKEAREMVVADIEMRLKTPDSRMPTIAQALSQPVIQAIKKNLKVSDDDVRKSYDKFVFKRIAISKNDVAAVAKRAEADLKGGMSFEAAMTRYSDDIAAPGKKLTDTTSEMSRSTLDGIDFYAPLLKLKVGEVSSPITIDQSIVFFKLISMKSDLPKDFDKKKDTYRDTVATSKAATALTQELKDTVKKAKFDWKNDSYKAVYEYGRIYQDTTPGKEQREKLLQLLQDAKKASENSASAASGRASTLVAYVVFQGLEENASPEEKAKLDPLKVDVYRLYLNDNEDPAVHLELAKIYLAKKNEKDLSDQLQMAANGNVSRTDPAGQSVYNEINKVLKQAQDAKLIKDADAKSVSDLQRQWVDMKVEKDKMDAEDRKREEERQKELIEQEKKLKEEDAKKAADAKKNKGKPAGPGTGDGSILTPPSPGPTTGTTTAGTGH